MWELGGSCPSENETYFDSKCWGAYFDSKCRVQTSSDPRRSPKLNGMIRRIEIAIRRIGIGFVLQGTHHINHKKSCIN